MIELIFKPKGKPQRNIEIKEKQVLTVGRDKDTVDIHLPEIEVSRRQCRFSVVDGRIVVEPLKASSPIRTKRGPLLQKTVLQAGDYVAFGKYRVFPGYPTTTEAPTPAAKAPQSSRLSAVLAPLAKRLQWRPKFPSRRKRVKPSEQTLDPLGRAAREWDQQGRPLRLLLRGRQCRQASKLAIKNDLILKFVNESTESLRTYHTKLALYVLTLCLAGVGGTLTAHAVTRELELAATVPPQPVCSDASLNKLRGDASDSVGLLGAVESNYKAEKLNCGFRATDLEIKARELLKLQSRQLFASVDTPPEFFVLSPDDRHAAMVVDGTLSVISREETNAKKLVDQTVTSVAWSPDGGLLTGHSDGKVSIWEEQRSEWHETPGKQHREAVVSIAPGRQGNYFISTSENGGVNLWALTGSAKGRIVDRASVPSAPRRAFIDRQEQRVVVQTSMSIYTWDISANAQLVRQKTLSIAPVKVALSGDGNTILASDNEGSLLQFQRTKKGAWSRGRKIYAFANTHDYSFAYSAKHKCVVVVDGLRVLRSAGETNHDMLPFAQLGKTSAQPEPLLLSASEDVAITVTGKGAQLWDVATGTKGANGQIETSTKWKSFTLSTERDRLFAADEKHLYAWDLPPQHNDSILLAKHTDTRKTQRPQKLPLAATGSEVTVLTTANATTPKIFAWKTTTNGIPQSHQEFSPSHNPAVVALSQTGEFIASANKTEVQVWRASSPDAPEINRTFPGEDGIKHLAFVGDSRLVAATNTQIVMWKLSNQTQKQPRPWSVGTGSIRTLTTSGRHVAVGVASYSEDINSVRVWDALAQPVLDHSATSLVTELLFSYNGSWLVAGTQSGQLYTWQFTEGNPEEGHAIHLREQVTALAFSTTEETPLVAAGGSEGFFATFPVRENRGKTRENGKIRNRIQGLAFGPKPNVLIVAYEDGGLVKWYTDSLDRISLGHAPASTIAAPNSGNFVFTLSQNGGKTTVRAWPVDARSLWTYACRSIGPECTVPAR